MKIALLSFEFPPETGFGGIGTYTWYQARALARLGHEVHVLAGATSPTELTSTQIDGVHVHRYRARGVWMGVARLFGRIGCHWTRNRLENAWCMYLGFKLLSREHRFDILEMPECGAEGALVNWLTRTPSVVRFHSPARLIMPFYETSWGDHLLCSCIEQVGIRGATALTSCSRFLADAVASELGVRKPIEVVANGIDLALFDQEPVSDLAQLYDLPAGKLTILFAGRMERRKGVHLCKAIAEILLRRHDVLFLFAGEDLFGYVRNTLMPELEAMQLAGSVRYLGKLDLRQLRACARAVDIYLLPSLWENCPYACLEAMAAGRAIVCSDQGGLPELIADGSNGLLAESESPASFAAQIERLIVDAWLREELGRAARKTIEERFTEEGIARLSVDLYERCLHPDRQSSGHGLNTAPVK